jgi:hypothetical protein
MEDTARAIGAAAGTVTINGKTRKLRPLTVRELAEVERECLRAYRRQYMEAYTDSINFLPAGTDKMALIMRKTDEICRWDVKDLPPQTVYDPSDVVVTPSLVALLRTKLSEKNGGAPRGDTENRGVAAILLNNRTLTPDEYQAAAGVSAVPHLVSYVQWWVTGCFAGMVTFIASCVEGNDLTRNEIEDYIADSGTRAAQVAKELEAVSSPRSDFGAPPG